MLIWIVIVLAALTAGGALAVRSSRTRSRAALQGRLDDQGHLLQRTVKEVRLNDVVQHAGHDYLVEGVVQYDEDGHTWRAARVVDGGVEHWLLVGLERGAAPTLRLLDVAQGLEVSGYPPETLEHASVSYKLDKRGTANATFEGDVKGVPTGPEGSAARCRWWKYQAAGEKVLVLEQWGDVFRALAGISVPVDDVDLLGAS
jgi:hypothetical protein